jgi:hypothetical protein
LYHRRQPYKVKFKGFPKDFKRPDRASLESMLDGKSNPLIWMHKFSDSSLLSRGPVVINVKATDKAGNASQIQVVDSAMRADFDVNIKSN